MNGTRYSTDPRDFHIIKGQEIPIPEYKFSDRKVSYWQSEVAKNSCSVHGCMSTIANNFGIDFTLEERKAIWDMAKERGATDEGGWWLHKAAKLLRDYCKKHKNLDLVYYRVDWEQYEELVEAGFSIACGYRNKLGMNQDRRDCTIGEDIETYGDVTYGHLVSFCDVWGHFGFVDNYPGRHKCNITKVVNVKELVEAGVLFTSGYIYTYENPVRKGYNTLTLEEKVEKLKART